MMSSLHMMMKKKLMQDLTLLYYLYKGPHSIFLYLINFFYVHIFALKRIDND